ncbi:MAG TPA: winged helix-turn-helix transcriptional regulator [Candidatus Bathyarchaeota archaeon]|nr:winged helix-turn-helix transcriptional regulator [Candidatus Bathyarchaeota archaeon]
MSASKIRGKILRVLWAAGKPMTLQGIAKKTGLTSPSTTQYLTELINAKYVSAPSEQNYAITSRGKQALGLPKVDKQLALNILAPVSVEKAFHFYYGLSQHSGVYADSLKDFVDKIQTVNLKSIEFHVPRKDFELWIRSLGDLELSKKLELLRMKSLSGESLRKELHETVNSRYEELNRLTV